MPDRPAPMTRRSKCCAFIFSSCIVPGVFAGPCRHRLVEGALASIGIFRHTFVISRHWELIELGSLLRATTLFGYGDLVRELGGDPELFLSRFRMPGGIEDQEDAFISFDA